MTRGMIFDIKRFALHDGEGLRTTLFFKGCTLHCPWCQNPEGIDSSIHLRWSSSRCLHCGLCVKSCPVSALSRMEPDDRISIDHSICNLCGICVEECPSGALKFDGRQVDADEVAEELLRDRVFFDVSGGGITLSGGEPLMQPEFALELTRRLRSAGVSVTMETSLAVERESLEPFIGVIDLFYVDQKLADEQEHLNLLGSERNLVRSNLEYLCDSGSEVIIRIPLIPGFTTDMTNLNDLGNYFSTLGPPVPPVELLNFNPLAENKYRMLGKKWPVAANAERLSPSELEGISRLLRDCGIERIYW